MKFKFTIILFTILTVAFSLNAQSVKSLTVLSNGSSKEIPVYDREGTVYFSLLHLADALSVPFNYSSEDNKVYLNFRDSRLVVTADDPYLIILPDGSAPPEVIQLPTTVYFLHGKIFLPLAYTSEILEKASGAKFTFNKPDKLKVEDLSGLPTADEASEKAGFNITGLSIDEKANGTLVRVKSNKRIPSYNSSFKDGILSLVFRGVHADAGRIDKTGGEGLITDITAENKGPDAVIHFKLRKEYTASEVLNVDNSNDLLITLHNKIFENKLNKVKEKAKWKFNTVVIDPGHGGKDSGTIGVYGIKEKNVNLAIGLKLGALIKKHMKDVKVVFTRKTDKFIELYRRGQIANEAGGNLFISIHCNATPHKPSNVSGFEVYLLRPGRTKEAINIAERENAVISYEANPARYKKLTDENFILVSMAQSAYMRYSEKFADLVDKELSKNSTLQERGVKQAGFYVLVGASMPSVLVETGFLSNRHDARYLNSRKGQEHIAEGIYKAVKEFKSLYEKNINNE